MNPPPSNDEKYEFWKHSFARQSFFDTKIFLEQIIQREDPDESPILKSLTISALICYARPFKHQRRTKLLQDTVPDKFLPLHQEMITLRDRIIAHRDLGRYEEWAKVNRLDFHIHKGHIDVNTRSVVMEQLKAREVNELLSELIAKMDTKIAIFVQTHIEYLARFSGIYALRFDQDVDWIEKMTTSTSSFGERCPGVWILKNTTKPSFNFHCKLKAQALTLLIVV
ncbi:MAG: hypothetical protein WD708_06490 [Kiritimatiellia bacterium]